MDDINSLNTELKSKFNAINDYKLLKIIRGYENTIYCLLKGDRIFYLKEILNPNCFARETYVLSNLNEGDYLIPKIEESLTSKQANIITEVRGNVLEIITTKDAQKLGISLKNLHTECGKFLNFPNKNIRCFRVKSILVQFNSPSKNF